jgi:hypothetical protein
LEFHAQQKSKQKIKKNNNVQDKALNDSEQFKNNNVPHTDNTIAEEIPMVVLRKPLLEREQSEDELDVILKRLI